MFKSKLVHFGLNYGTDSGSVVLNWFGTRQGFIQNVSRELILQPFFIIGNKNIELRSSKKLDGTLKRSF